jgi:outer membrane protein OmpA-like peptidoglycan-associated protein
MLLSLSWSLAARVAAAPAGVAAPEPVAAPAGVAAPTRVAAPAQYNLRMGAGVGLMVSDYQIKKLSFDKPALLGSFHLARELAPWLEARAGLHGASFWRSSDRPGRGGLLALTAGSLLRVPRDGLSPYVALDFGVGVTGVTVRPVLFLSAGVDVPVSSRIKLGPVMGFNRVVQWDDNRFSPDARYFWFGLSLRDRVGKDPPPPPPAPAKTRWVRLPPEPVAAPEPEVRVETETVEVMKLIERALPTSTKRVELLAPVLFGFDSDVLEPIGIAMLHEVLETLHTRADIKLVQIQGYADGRGDTAYNQALSSRRAERVRAWLVEHGIAAERLTTDARGESSMVEGGSTEGAHEQNRRVIFRVLETEEP